MNADNSWWRVQPLGLEDWKIRGILMFWRIGFVPFKYRGTVFVLIRNLGVIHCLFSAQLQRMIVKLIFKS